MILFTRDLLKQYEQADVILKLLNSSSDNKDKTFTSHKWLLDSMPKRMIYKYMYGDLLDLRSQHCKMLDVGGGYTDLTKVFLIKHNYYLLDIMSHDNHDNIRMIERNIQKSFWINQDWYDFQPEGIYDVVIANDLFPNVDQRIEQFIKKYIPFSREIRISLTYYNDFRFYKVKRIDADEVFFVLPWNGFQISHVIEKFSDRISGFNSELFILENESIFPNQRQVMMISIKGDK